MIYLNSYECGILELKGYDIVIYTIKIYILNFFVVLNNFEGAY